MGIESSRKAPHAQHESRGRNSFFNSGFGHSPYKSQKTDLIPLCKAHFVSSNTGRTLPYLNHSSILLRALSPPPLAFSASWRSPPPSNLHRTPTSHKTAADGKLATEATHVSSNSLAVDGLLGSA